MYPAAVLVGFGVIDILFKKIALYTSLHLQFAICDFRYSFDADRLHPIYDVIVRKQDYVLSISSLVG
jgi:hypothetical protein